MDDEEERATSDSYTYSAVVKWHHVSLPTKRREFDSRLRDVCLMCEGWPDVCYEPECYEAAGPYDSYNGMERFDSRTRKMAIWRGYGDDPCDHIKAEYPDWESHRN